MMLNRKDRFSLAEEYLPRMETCIFLYSWPFYPSLADSDDGEAYVPLTKLFSISCGFWNIW